MQLEREGPRGQSVYPTAARPKSGAVAQADRMDRYRRLKIVSLPYFCARQTKMSSQNKPGGGLWMATVLSFLFLSYFIDLLS